MIFYFSGTGNSRWVANELAQRLEERLVHISEAFASGQYEYSSWEICMQVRKQQLELDMEQTGSK